MSRSAKTESILPQLGCASMQILRWKQHIAVAIGLLLVLIVFAFWGASWKTVPAYTCGRNQLDPALKEYSGGWAEYDVLKRRSMYPEDYIGYEGGPRLHSLVTPNSDVCQAMQDADRDLQPLSHIAQCNVEEMLFGTRTAQAIIYQHQNPQNAETACQEKKYLFFVVPNYGLGSILHITTAILAIAMENNRILVPAYTPMCAFDNSDGTPFYDCYFEEMSSCTTWARKKFEAQTDESDMRIDEDTNIPHAYMNLPHLTNKRDITDEQFAFMTYEILEKESGYTRHLAPFQMKQLLDCSPINPEDSYYWWRAQGVAYLLRPDGAARMELDARMRMFYESGVLPPHSVALHIRRGDKEKELDKVTSDEDFVSVLRETVLSEDWTTRQMNIPKGQHVYVSTEHLPSLDAIINAFKTEGDENGPLVSYATVPRHSSDNSPMRIAKVVGPHNEVFNSLLNLRLSIQAHSTVGVFGSNWVRLIDELRSTIGCHAKGYMLDPSFDDYINGYRYDW